MAVILKEVPERFNLEQPSKVSRWACSRHPYIFKFWRIDAGITTYVDNGGFLRIILDTTQTACSEIVVGGTISLYDNEDLYSTTGTVTAIISPGVPNYIFDTDIPFAGFPVASGWLLVNARENYNVEVAIYGTDALTGNEKLWGTARVSTDAQGYATLNVQEYINGYVRKTNAFGYNIKNELDRHCWGSFRITYIGKWSTSQEASVVNEGRTFYLVDATKYLLNTYGQNLMDYTTLNFGGITNRAKFLTDFPRPTYFPGLPFDLSVIITDEFTSAIGVTTNEKSLDINGADLGSQDYAIIVDRLPGVHRVMLEGGYPSTVASIDFWLNAGDYPGEEYFTDGYIADGYFESIAPVAVTPFRITEIKNIKVKAPCRTNLVFLCWRNSKGGWSVWTFSHYQEVNSSVKVSGTFGTEPENLEFATSRELTTEINHSERMTVGDLVDIEDIAGLKFMESSPRILMLQNPFAENEVPVWLTVKISPKGVKYRTDAGKVDVEFDIMVPDFYTVPN